MITQDEHKNAMDRIGEEIMERMDKDTQEIIDELKDIISEIEMNRIGIRKFNRSKELKEKFPTRGLELEYIKISKKL